MKNKKKKHTIEPKINPETNKKILTCEIVKNDLKNQKSSFFTYILYLLGIAIAIALGYFLLWAFYLFVVNCLIQIVKTFRTNRNRKSLAHQVLSVPCIEKNTGKDDDRPNELRLWFRNIKGDLHVAVVVEKEDYDATQLGDLFHIVFVPKEDVPCLWYRDSEWELDRSTWPQKDKNEETNAE